MNSDFVDTFPLSLSQPHDGYYSGNFSNILKTQSPSPPFSQPYPRSDSSNYLSFEIRDVQKTNQEGIIKVEADLRIRVFRYDSFFVADSSYRRTYFSSFFRRSSGHEKIIRSSFQFRLEGFWSESSKKLCMVGSAFSGEREGEGDLGLEAVLKMENIATSVNITSLFTGTLESLSSSDDIDHHSDAVSILMFPRRNYQYSLVSKMKEARGTVTPGGRNLPVGLSLEKGRFCSSFDMATYSVKLEYAANCDDPAKNCTPFGGGNYGHQDSLPQMMSGKVLECSEADQKLRLLLDFSDMYLGYYGSFHPNRTLVGEGLWDESRNRLQIVACKIHTNGGSFSSARVEDCSIELSFLFPATWSIKERNAMMGEIRSKKSTKELGYFSPVAIEGAGRYRSNVPGVKYKYTEAERVRRLCPAKKLETNISVVTKYPDRFSHDMSFSMAVQLPGGEHLGWGYSYPVFVGNRAYDRFAYEIPVSKKNSDSAIKTSFVPESRFNISYQMSLSGNMKFSGRTGIATPQNGLDLSEGMEISAEGVYNTKTGGLCMVGCRSLEKSKLDSMDCEILINFQFPPLDPKKAKDPIKGSIESTRERSDPLYFDRLNISATTLYAEESRRSIWRLDLELSLVLISNTISCFFLGLQILYVRKSPQVLPIASLLMLTILALGSAVPLVLNFEELFLESRSRQSFYFESRSQFESSEVLVRVATLIACLFQFCLLRLSISSRWGEGGHEKSWAAEKKALLLSLPLYALGAFAALLVNWKANPEISMWGTLRCYAGLVLDGFLLPQILLNIFRDSNEKALSVPFYVGMTLVRLIPHGYDLWRVLSFVRTQFSSSYIYGIPETDFYSTAWDVIIPLGGITFAAVIYLQQRFGGCCIVPRRFRKNSVNYEKLPVVSDA